MPSERKCDDCGRAYPSQMHYCAHCARPAKYRNVEHADEPREREALDLRYIDAVESARKRGALPVVEEFERAVGQSQAVICRRLGEVERLAASPNEAYATFYALVDAGIRMLNGDKYNRLRVSADPALFYGYHENIRFAALTINTRGLPGYGDCHILLREDMIAHRTSVFEENSLDWVLRHDLSFADVFKDEYELPAGSRATWDRRGRMAAAKMADEIDPTTGTEDFPELLMRPKTSLDDLDRFIEAHIWGPLTVYSIDRISLPEGSGETKEQKADRLAIADRLRKANLTVDVK